jgi:Zn-dependent peptidase ImmA (M78 family)/DNA-binding XRE family transcriptional regulator
MTRLSEEALAMNENPLDAVDPRTLGARLKEVRDARGWTQQQVAERLGFARTTMVAIEKGDRRLKPGELIELAKLYGRQVSDLLQRGAPAEGFAVQLRGALPPAAPIDADLLPFIEEFQTLCEDYARLEAICEAPLPRRYPPEYGLGGVDPEVAAEDVAASERSRLALGEGPLLNLRETLEADVGLRVFQMKLPSEVAGFFAFTDALGGCIAVNLLHPFERRRASLAQEYGHFLTSRYRSEVLLQQRYERRPTGERFSEAFARALLMPATGLRRRFLDLGRARPKGVTHGDLCRLAHVYAASVEAMTRRLEELRLIPAGTWDRLRLEGFAVRKAQELLGLEPLAPDDDLLLPRFVALAVEAWQRGELSEGQLARLLRSDRLGVRARVQQDRTAPGEGGEPEPTIDLAAPLLRSVGG